ncbi:putative transporter [Venturia inaequalis]|nr:putative transporter [Venturia inaequalis]
MRTSFFRAGLPFVLGLTSCLLHTTTAENSADPPKNSRTPGRIASVVDWNELEWAAMLSSAAYAGCIGRTHDVEITHQISDRATATQGFIGVSDQRKRIEVVFRGSNQLTDFINDVDTRKVPVTGLNGVSFPPGVEIMHGIHRPWMAVHDDVIAHVKLLTTKYPTYAIGVTGHSLGGSMTYLGFPVLTQIFPTKQIFAVPLNAFPIGNEAFAQFSSKQISARRVVKRGTQNKDGVPNMYTPSSPLTILPLAPVMQHYGTEYYTNGTRLTTIQCEGERDRSCSAGNGATGPTPQHHYSFGVDMGPSGAMGCMASGGSYGANGGTMRIMGQGESTDAVEGQVINKTGARKIVGRGWKA